MLTSCLPPSWTAERRETWETSRVCRRSQPACPARGGTSCNSLNKNPLLTFPPFSSLRPSAHAATPSLAPSLSTISTVIANSTVEHEAEPGCPWQAYVRCVNVVASSPFQDLEHRWHVQVRRVCGGKFSTPSARESCGYASVTAISVVASSPFQDPKRLGHVRFTEADQDERTCANDSACSPLPDVATPLPVSACTTVLLNVAPSPTVHTGFLRAATLPDCVSAEAEFQEVSILVDSGSQQAPLCSTAIA
jgi:hypothetical protein